MTDATSTTSTTPTSTDAVKTDDEKVTYEKGSWQESLQKSNALMVRSAADRKKASHLLWTGAQVAISEWLPKATTDSTGETLYGSIIDVLGVKRKGDASKIKTVAIAVVKHNLVLASHENLSKAYAEATRLTKTVADEAAEDDAAEKAIEGLAVPNSTTTVEGAALILLGKGIDGAVVAILDALGANNEAAHRAFMRALSSEIADRVQAAKPKPVAKASGPKAGATQATKAAAPKATVADGSTKAKTKAEPATKAAPKAKATPVSASKGDPNKKALPVKVKATPVPVAKAG